MQLCEWPMSAAAEIKCTIYTGLHAIHIVAAVDTCEKWMKALNFMYLKEMYMAFSSIFLPILY